MESRRFITFLVFFFAFTYLYQGLIAPLLFPRRPPAVPATEPQRGEESEDDQPAADQPAVEAAEAVTNDQLAVDLGRAEFPRQEHILGSLDPESGFALQVETDSRGASIRSVFLTDPRFRELDDQSRQVKVLGNEMDTDQTLSVSIDRVDRQLLKAGLSLETVNWDVAESSEAHIIYEYPAPDGSMVIRKEFRLNELAFDQAGSPRQAFSEQTKAYTIETTLELVSQKDGETTVQYELQGPVGIVLENEDHAQKYRDIKLEFLGDDDPVTYNPATLDDAYTDVIQSAGRVIPEGSVRAALRQKQAWTGMFRYAGVDVQFFAALISVLDERTPEERSSDRWIERIYPVMVQKNAANESLSDLTIRLVSTPQTLSGKGDSVTHRYGMFVGPKRRDLLESEPFVADQVLDYGSWFGFIARMMHRLLDMFYGLGMPYFLAIICLTVLVRGLMFPISRKQAIMAAKQKALAPKLNELKLKFGDDREKMARAQMELWRKHGINPLGGCLPIFIQLPVFIGLYTCLNTAVDLRLAQFLWVDNLAAPDALFTMPRLPYLGSDFNLLPCITVVLFLVQQKLFMPPPADEQAEMTQKMMNFMTIFMGFMFWHVPAGLCIYFIASSLWGIAERKLLKVNVTAPEPSVTVRDSSADVQSGEKPAPTGFLGRMQKKMQDALEEAQRQADQVQKQASTNKSGGANRGDGGSRGKKKRKKR